MTVFTGLEFYAPVVVETGGNFPIRSDRLYNGKVAIGDAQRLVRSSELNAVTCREGLRTPAIDADTSESTRVVIGNLTRRSLDRQNVGG